MAASFGGTPDARRLRGTGIGTGTGLDQRGPSSLLFHAAALHGRTVALASNQGTDVCRPIGRLVWRSAALCIGGALFAGDVAARAFIGARLFPMAAPTGGMILIASWLVARARGVAGAVSLAPLSFGRAEARTRIDACIPRLDSGLALRVEDARKRADGARPGMTGGEMSASLLEPPRLNAPRDRPMNDKSMTDPHDAARILSEALPHMQRYDEETIVIKYGGHAMGDEARGALVRARHRAAGADRDQSGGGARRRAADRGDAEARRRAVAVRRRACASPTPRRWKSSRWCWPARSTSRSSATSTPPAARRSGCAARTATW